MRAGDIEIIQWAAVCNGRAKKHCHVADMAVCDERWALESWRPAKLGHTTSFCLPFSHLGLGFVRVRSFGWPKFSSRRPRAARCVAMVYLGIFSALRQCSALGSYAG
jgi:hypothetical protein